MLIHFFGLKRSGNHAVIPWLMNNAFDDKPLKPLHYNDIYIYIFQPNFNRITALDSITHQPGQDMLLSYEDVPLDKIACLPTVLHQGEINKDGQNRTILLLRSPLNYIASRLQRLRNLKEKSIINNPVQLLSMAEATQLWIDYANEFLGVTKYLPPNTIYIKYDDWFFSKKYRDDIVSILFGGANRDIGIDEVEFRGGGSSFDGVKLTGRAQQMKVMERWEQFVGDEEYIYLINTPRLKDLSMRIFNNSKAFDKLELHPQLEH